MHVTDSYCGLVVIIIIFILVNIECGNILPHIFVHVMWDVLLETSFMMGDIFLTGDTLQHRGTL